MTARRRALPFLSLILAAALSAPHQVAAQPAAPVADLATDPSLSESSNPEQLTVVRGGRVVFVATIPGSGQEVWTTDGTDAGTRMLADVCPGPCSSLPEILGAVGGGALWVESGGGRPDGIWSTDGTREGTFPLADGGVPLTVFRRLIEGDVPDYQPLDRALLGGRMYFQACGAVHGCGVWSSDGTAVGTGLAVPGSKLGGASIGAMAAAGGQVFFLTDAVSGGSGPALWRTDGTTAGTLLLASFASAPRALTAAGSRVFFTAPRDGNDEDLWTSDGTRQGTRPLTHFTTASPFTPGPSFQPVLRAFGSHVDFAADDGGHGWEIWRSDGTAGGTRRATDFKNPQPFSFFSLGVSGLLEVQGRILVQATDGATGWKLWASTGNPASTQPLHDCAGGCGNSSSPGHGLLGAVGGRALFLAEDAVHGIEPWSTDGTPAGTQLVRDLCPGTCSSQINAAVLLPGGLGFVAFPSDLSPAQLWVSDGTSAGTRTLTHFTEGSSAGDSALPVSAPGGRIFFSARNADGTEPWMIERGVPRQVANLAPDAPSSNPRALTPVDGKLVFQATVDGTTRLYAADGTGDIAQLLAPINSPDPLSCPSRCGPTFVSLGSWAALLAEPLPGPSGFQLFRTDGTAAGTVQLTNVAAPDRIDLSLAALSSGNVLFFVERHDRRELWRSDGTAAGTMMVAVVPGSIQLAPPAGGASTGAQAWFAINGSSGGDAGGNGKATLWRSDGTPAGTSAAVTLPDGLEVLNLPFTRAGGKVFFETEQLAGTRDVQLWSTDGTAAGTIPLTLGPGFGVFEMREFNGALLYLAFDASLTGGLWRSDGTPEGTVRLQEFSLFNEDHTQVRPSGLTVAGGRVFFAAQGRAGGTELWASDGTAAGTYLVKDINTTAPDASSDPANFVAAGAAGGDRVFFSAFDGVHGIELWESDGTDAGTRMVQDIAPEGLSSSPDQLTVVGDRLYFTADDGVIGRELWSLPLTGTGGCRPSATVLCLGAGGRYQVEVVWRDPQDHRGSGMAVPLTGGVGGNGDTGAFWFFSATNLELVVKVLDGTGVNGHVWVFYGALSNVEYTLTVTDTQTGLARRYFNPQGQLASVGDVHAFGPLGAKSRNPAPLIFPPSGAPVTAVRTAAGLGKAVCDPAPSALCLGEGRFVVTVAWKDFQGHTGLGMAVPLTGDTGAFWFFNASNLELIVKVLDGTAVNGHFWVFYGALSNVEYTITVTDVQTFRQRTYTNPSGRFASAADTEAF
jgi:large repetitive protein